MQLLALVISKYGIPLRVSIISSIFSDSSTMPFPEFSLSKASCIFIWILSGRAGFIESINIVSVTIPLSILSLIKIVSFTATICAKEKSNNKRLLIFYQKIIWQSYKF